MAFAVNQIRFKVVVFYTHWLSTGQCISLTFLLIIGYFMPWLGKFIKRFQKYNLLWIIRADYKSLR